MAEDFRGWLLENWDDLVDIQRDEEWSDRQKRRFLAWQRNESAFKEEDLKRDIEGSFINEDVHSVWWGFSASAAIVKLERGD